MRSSRFVALTVVLGSCGGTAVALILSRTQGAVAIGLLGALLGWIGFTLCPWAVVPVGVLGGTAGAVLAGQTDVRSVVAMHLLPLLAGVAALLTRRMLGLDREQDRPPLPTGSLVVLLGVTGAGALYGLAVRNAPADVLVATYQVGVIPVYLVITMYTLNTRAWQRRAAILYVTVITVLAATSLFSPGRHGGLLSLLPIPLLVVCAGRAHGWRRTGLVLVAALLAADVALASYRGIWVAGALALVVLAVRGAHDVRRGLVSLAAACTFLAVSFSIVGGLSGRLSVVREALGRDAGYRGSESRVGLRVFAENPVLGGGLGQSTRHVFIPGLGFDDVGPTYHSFYVTVLANLGLVGLLAVFVPIARIVWPLVRRRAGPLDGVPLAFAALTCGFLASAAFESPTDGHWELGLLPALTLLGARARRATEVPLPLLVGASR